MGTTVFVWILISALYPSSLIASNLQSCRFGQEKWVNCNRCRCLWAWTTWTCTHNVCSSSEMAGYKKECVHGATKMNDCNNCTCQHGKWVCDRALCNTECTDGHQKTKDCNSCLCIGGKYRCTEYPCLIHEDRICNPGKKQMMACNECFCHDTANTLVCTNMSCS